MIKEVWLYTNRNVMVFDENGEQVADIQKILSWDSLKSWNELATEKALEKVIEAKPVICIGRWNNWGHRINLDEFCCLLGKGQWYWEYKQEKEEAVCNDSAMGVVQ
jgi:hypothetical protein